jgi:endonuclease YncB( thermonuclease family)
MTDWLKYNINTTTTLSLKNTECYARVVHIHDGDTLTAIIPVFGSYYKFSIRLNGIDTCEIKSKNEVTQKLSVDARNRLINLITDRNASDINDDVKKYLLDNVVLVFVKCNDFDKYGRVLATVSKSHSDAMSFSDILVKEKLAYVYSGKTKLTEEEQIAMLK